MERVGEVVVKTVAKTILLDHRSCMWSPITDKVHHICRDVSFKIVLIAQLSSGYLQRNTRKIYIMLKVPRSSIMQVEWSSDTFTYQFYKDNKRFAVQTKLVLLRKLSSFLRKPTYSPYSLHPLKEQCLVGGCCWSIPFHDNEEASLSMMYVLINIQDVDNMRTPWGPPVIFYFLTSFWVVIQEL